MSVSSIYSGPSPLLWRQMSCPLGPWVGEFRGFLGDTGPLLKAVEILPLSSALCSLWCLLEREALLCTTIMMPGLWTVKLALNRRMGWYHYWQFDGIVKNINVLTSHDIRGKRFSVREDENPIQIQHKHIPDSNMSVTIGRLNKRYHFWLYWL